MSSEYWKWSEVGGKSTGIAYTRGSVATAGVDVGAVSSKAAILVDGKLAAYSILHNELDSASSGKKALGKALAAAGIGIEKVTKTVGTGYGRANMNFADATEPDIACIARGAFQLYGPSVRTVLDIGGQSTKAIMVDQYGKADKFMLNDKCSSGVGRGIEIFADMMAIPIEDIGKLSLDVDEEPEPVSSTCITYANSMAAQMMRRAPMNKVLAAYCYSIAWKNTIMLKRLANQSGDGTVAKDVVFTGGVTKNKGIVSRIEKELGIEALKNDAVDPQIAGAVGAAVLASKLVMAGAR